MSEDLHEKCAVEQRIGVVHRVQHADAGGGGGGAANFHHIVHVHGVRLKRGNQRTYAVLPSHTVTLQQFHTSHMNMRITSLNTALTNQ